MFFGYVIGQVRSLTVSVTQTEEVPTNRSRIG